MEQKKQITTLSLIIAVGALVAAGTGIFSREGPGPFSYTSIRGEELTIHGFGIYQHMSADVAVQGIAQDYVTFFLAVPALVLALFLVNQGGGDRKKRRLGGRYFLAGVSGYFLVTYLFYLVMGMYNRLFLLYVLLLACSFFSFFLQMQNIRREIAAFKAGGDSGDAGGVFRPGTPLGFAGGLLIFNALIIALLWLSVIVPPLLDGSLYPEGIDHYTTMIVQGLDLGLLLPLAFLTGRELGKRRGWGLAAGPVYLVFLSFLMTALTAKIIGMGMVGAAIFPAVVIIPGIQTVTIITTILVLRGAEEIR